MTSQYEHNLTDFKEVLLFIICQNPTVDCFFNKCEKCPKVAKLEEYMTKIFYEEDIDEISYKQWVSTPITTLVTIISTSEEFISSFCSNIKSLLTHHYICKMQSLYLKDLKSSLQDGEIIVICDFAQNYAFVVQNAAPGFHWNNNQATVYCMVYYYKWNDEIRHEGFVVISDALNHDSILVYTFHKLFVKYIKNKFPRVKIIKEFKDGAPQHFKNYKSVLNLYYHEQEFGIKNEFHYFPTAHGKGPCDGLGGTIKRAAARASLQLPVDKQILTSEDLFKWLKYV